MKVAGAFKPRKAWVIHRVAERRLKPRETSVLSIRANPYSIVAPRRWSLAVWYNDSDQGDPVYGKEPPLRACPNTIRLRHLIQVRNLCKREGANEGTGRFGVRVACYRFGSPAI